MAYGLDAFAADLHAILTEKGIDGLDAIADKLKLLVADPDFVAATFDAASPPQRVLFHDAETDAYVLAHVQEAGKSGVPHSHGASWAIYGNARGTTRMTEWRRVNPASEDHAALEIADRYEVGPGEARAYGPHVIHSTAHPDGAWVIRVTGTKLESIPRYYFRPKKDTILESAAAGA